MGNRIEEFSVDHLKTINKDYLAALGLRDDWMEKATAFRMFGPCYSAFNGDDLVACAGVNILWPGVGEAWMVSTPNIFANKKFLHKSVKDILQRIINNHSLFRVQATVLFGFEKGRIWVERLGFKREGVMKKYDRDGNDYWLYAMVRE